MKIARTGIVSQSCPDAQDFLLGNLGQGARIGKALKETSEIRDHGMDRGLLEHDFRNPGTVGRDPRSPGQGTLGGTIPGQEIPAKETAGD